MKPQQPLQRVAVNGAKSCSHKLQDENAKIQRRSHGENAFLYHKTQDKSDSSTFILVS